MGLYSLITNAPLKDNGDGTFTNSNGQLVDANNNQLNANGTPMTQSQKFANSANKAYAAMGPSVQNNVQVPQQQQVNPAQNAMQYGNGNDTSTLNTLLNKLGGS